MKANSLWIISLALLGMAYWMVFIIYFPYVSIGGFTHYSPAADYTNGWNVILDIVLPIAIAITLCALTFFVLRKKEVARESSWVLSLIASALVTIAAGVDIVYTILLLSFSYAADYAPAIWSGLGLSVFVISSSLALTWSAFARVMIARKKSPSIE